MTKAEKKKLLKKKARQEKFQKAANTEMDEDWESASESDENNAAAGDIADEQPKTEWLGTGLKKINFEIELVSLDLIKVVLSVIMKITQ